ncbi:efflux RND transporter permease subunit [Leptospira weilii]|uniref:Heavy metal efflux pump, CzcA family n=1 Tax=Leptospira weilii str. UI 13098 TaxID=1088542 RepID=M6QKW4_9LEPT|nr:efflux RND transporter permease subunit [Leptospira weilii]EMN89512.1 heavy metal efflux pump, CzcA family [Leptospira weilii str. UI 13098]
MEAVIRFCVNRPVTTAMIWSALCVFGLISLQKLKINLLPELEYPKASILTSYQNASPEEIENLITKPLTDAVGTVPGIEKISSESSEGSSIITVQFSNRTKIDYAIIEIRERIDLVRDILPQDATRPIVTRFDPSKASFQEIVFFPKGDFDPKELRSFIEENVKIHIERIEGLASVQLSGGHKKEIRIKIDSEKMNAYGLSPLDVKRAIIATNINVPAGSLPVGNKDLLIRTVGEFDSIDDLKTSIVGANQQGISIPLSSFSDVEEGYRERTGIARYNGKDCVIVYLFKEPGKNSVEISEEVNKHLKQINEKFGKEITANIVYDESKFIKDSVSGVSGSLISGALLAFLVLIFLLKNVKSPIILLIVIPASLLTTFLFFYLFEISLNMMSLGGLALGIGMLFDTSNVIFSAIERNMTKGQTIEKASVNGTLEVAGSVVSATLTTVIVFLPIIFLKSVIGIVFSEMALAITISLITSLISSITIIPMFSSILYDKKIDIPFLNRAVFEYSEKLNDHLLRSYEKKLNQYLNNPRSLIIIIAVLLVFSLQFLWVVPKEFIPKVDTGEFSIALTLENGTKLESTAEWVNKLENTILETQKVESIISRIGYEEEQIAGKKGGNSGTNTAKIRVLLKEDSKIDTSEYIEEIRKKIPSNENIQITFENSGDIISSLVSSDSNKLILEIQGEDLKILNELGKNIKNKIEKIRGLKDIKESISDTTTEFSLNFDSIKYSNSNLNNEYLSAYLRLANHGSVVTRIKLNGKNTDVRMSFRKQDVNSVDKILNMKIRTPTGGLVQISQIGKIEEKTSPSSILRSGNVRINQITADIEPSGINDSIANVEEIVRNTTPPEGYKIQLTGEKENIEESFSDLTFTFILATLLIFMLLASQFESLKYSLIMICTIPLIFIGLFPALFLFGKSLNVSSFMGLVLLLGVVVDNAVLYYEYVNILSQNNTPLKTVIVESGKIVLKPILMNNSTTILGLLPIMLELQKGTEFQSPMAVVVIFGLCASFFFSLYLIPFLFYFLLKNRRP